MSKSLIRKNQLHPDISDLVSGYGDNFFITQAELDSAIIASQSAQGVVLITGNQTITGIKTFFNSGIFLEGLNIGGLADGIIKLTDNAQGSYINIAPSDGSINFQLENGNKNLSFDLSRISNGGNELIAIDSEVVHKTTNETISGVKTFASRPTFNGTGVLVSGDSAPAIAANYITVTVTNNSVTNGTNLLQAYTRAKTTLPNGNALSATNRLAIILPPAIYDLGTQSLILDTQYIDIVGSTPDRSKHHIKSNVGVENRGTVQQTANNVKLYNLTIENINNTYTPQQADETDPAAYFPNNDLNNTYLENINFIANGVNAWSMRVSTKYSGTFKGCTGGEYAFGGQPLGTPGIASGTFENCTGGAQSFGGSGTASGIFTNCTGESNSFGGNGAVASGTFKDCTGGDYAFGGGGGTASGTFKDCTGGDYAFGGDFGVASGTFTNCTGGPVAFGGGDGGGVASGIFTDCIGGEFSFGGRSGGTTSGTFTNCKGGDESFNL